MKIAVVTPKLLVGPAPFDVEDYQQLKSVGVTVILSLQSPEDLEGRTMADVAAAAQSVSIVFHNIPITDFDSLDLRWRLPKCIKVLNQLMSDGHTVYVHCTAGVMRSPTVAAAYLHCTEHWPLEAALERLHEVRNCTPLGDVIRHMQEFRTE
jgi:protein-tyrosine phosphatase